MAHDPDLRALVGRLNNVHEIFRIQCEILARGEETVESLAALLLSEPSGFPEPRVAAAECLGAIGTETAVEALIRVLYYHDLTALGPVQRFAEETVRNAARAVEGFAEWVAYKARGDGSKHSRVRSKAKMDSL